MSWWESVSSGKLLSWSELSEESCEGVKMGKTSGRDIQIRDEKKLLKSSDVHEPLVNDVNQ